MTTRNRNPIWLLLGGDWNEGADSQGRYSPAWLAAKTRMDIFTPQPGKRGHTGIDYILACMPVTDMVRLSGGGSDHHAVLFKVHHPENTDIVFTGVTWNVMRDRTKESRAEMLEFIRAISAEHNVDFWLLQEMRQYHDLVRDAIDGFCFYGSKDPDGVEHNAILVRGTHLVSHVRFRLTSTIGWITITGASHDPSSVALATLNRWCRVGSVHEASSVDWRDGEMVGPPRRLVVRIQSVRSLKRIARYWQRARGEF